VGPRLSARPDSVSKAGSTKPVPVRLHRAVANDCRQVWLWRNDEATRAASFDTAPISFETHQPWFHESLQRPDRHMYIVLADGHEAGVVRLDVADAIGTVSIYLSPAWRGRGIGPSALAALESIAFGPLGLRRIEARVKADNGASLAAFQKAGFIAVASKPPVSLMKVRRED
jgi:UDP-2,4-diacetamido-2,4,6-trideoxy-beta-L-altropyranose hydrolase